MMKLSGKSSAHSPESEVMGGGEAVHFPDWQARLMEREMGEEEREVWRRGILGMMRRCGMGRVAVTREAAREYWKSEREAGNAEVREWAEA